MCVECINVVSIEFCFFGFRFFQPCNELIHYDNDDNDLLQWKKLCVKNQIMSFLPCQHRWCADKKKFIIHYHNNSSSSLYKMCKVIMTMKIVHDQNDSFDYLSFKIPFENDNINSCYFTKRKTNILTSEFSVFKFFSLNSHWLIDKHHLYVMDL